MNDPSQPLVLVIDDYEPILTPIKYDLESEGFRCITTSDWDEALGCAMDEEPDLVVIDIVLKDEARDGLALAREIRACGLQMPIVFFTKHDDSGHMRRSLTIDGRRSDFLGKGVDDDMVLLEKSDGIEKLVTLIKARLAHYPQQISASLKLDRERRVVQRRSGESWVEVPLEPKEYELLVCLVDAGGSIVANWTMIERVFTERDGGDGDEEYYDEEKLLSRLYSYIHSVNRKLAAGGNDFHYLVNRRGLGYMFRPEEN